MRIYQINTYAGVGGAGIAVTRLNKALKRANVDSHVLSINDLVEMNGQGRRVLFGPSFTEKIWCRWRRFRLEHMRRRHRPRPTNFDLFAYDMSCYGMALLEACNDADVLNLHWVSDFLDYPYVLPRLRRDVPMVWTLHDLNPGTGGCFHPMKCTAFHRKCGNCPELGSGQNKDLSTEIWNRKAVAFNRLRPKLSLVAPSRWMAAQAQASSLLKNYSVSSIPNSVDTDVFCPRDRAREKERLGLSADRPVALFVAAVLDNPWKGLRHLLEAIPIVKAAFPQTQYVAIGHVDNSEGWPSFIKAFGPKSDEEELARIYASADLLMVPSVIDNFPNVILEAMSCGVPAAGFNVGGIPEAICEGETGFLAKQVSSQALAEVICQLLKEVTTNREDWSRRCRQRAVREFSLGVQARKYQDLYRSLLVKETF